MNDGVHHQLSVGDGWELTLTDAPPRSAPFQIVSVLHGRGRWARAGREQLLEPAVPWWSGVGGDHSWASVGPTRWLSLAAEHCPLPLALGDSPRCCSTLAADVRELASIVTDCPYPCELKNLLTRGKSLMVVSKTLAVLGEPEPRERSVVRFFEDDWEKVRQARTFLLDDMENPPSVPALARRVGLNEPKLKVGFRRLWGTTVYGLLRRERLAEAKRYLEAGRGNVGEAAFRVGYTNTSHFAEAFQREYGTSPGALLRSRT